MQIYSQHLWRLQKEVEAYFKVSHNLLSKHDYQPSPSKFSGMNELQYNRGHTLTLSKHLAALRVHLFHIYMHECLSSKNYLIRDVTSFRTASSSTLLEMTCNSRTILSVYMCKLF